MLKILRHLPRNLWWAVVLCLVLVVAQVWLDLKIPGYMSEITTIVMTAGSTTSQVLAIGGQMLLCALGSLASSITVGYFAARIAASFAHRLRELQFKQVMSFSSEQLGKFSTASLITRSTNDVTHVQMVISMGLQIIIKAPIMAVWAILKIASKSWEWTGITALAVLVLIAIITVIIIFVVPKFKQIQLLTDKLNSVARENLTGLRVVHAYNAEEYQQQKFAKVNEELTSTNLFVNRMSAILQPGMSLISNGLVLAVYWVGAVLIANTVATGRLELFSDMVVFSSYAMQVVMSFMMMTMIFIMVPRAQVSANRINEVLDTQPNIFDGPAEEGLPGLKGLVEFKNVSFKYPEAAEYVIQDISFTVNSGETVAFIGSTGSGKSTLINLIPRFYDVTGGAIFIDGIDIREYRQDVLRNKIGYVPQKAVIFSGTVASNVSYGSNGQPKANIEQIKQAVSIAQGSDFIEKMESQYEASLAREGTNISGGQKQRVSIARAVCRNPEIYIFDDSFSALDYKTDRLLRTALKKETKGAVNLIVAQRIGTIIDADRIIVMDKGRIVGTGTHKELLKSCAVYQEIAHSQLSKEELQK